MTQYWVMNCLKSDYQFYLFCLDLERQPKKKYRLEKDKVFGICNDSFGDRIELLSGLRDRIKPFWRSMVNPMQTVIKAPSKKEMGLKLKKQTRALLSVFRKQCRIGFIILETIQPL